MLRAPHIALLGATGALGEEILARLAARGFPLGSLRVFASPESEGAELWFRDEPVRVEALSSSALAQADLILCAAPGVLGDLLPDISRSRALLVDATGALELDPAVPLQLGESWVASAGGEGPPRRLAIARGVVAGLGLVLGPLEREAGLERVTVISLESASGAGRAGVHELTDQTAQLLNAMTGEAGEPSVFPRPLAFDCLPLVGEPLEGGESSEERRLGHVLRRLLARSTLPVEVTRVRVPIFGGSLACVHVTLAAALSPEEARALWEKQPQLLLLSEVDEPTPRSCMGIDEVQVGRIRAGGSGERSLAFVLGLDDLGHSALSVVVAAEMLLRAR